MGKHCGAARVSLREELKHPVRRLSEEENNNQRASDASIGNDEQDAVVVAAALEVLGHLPDVVNHGGVAGGVRQGNCNTVKLSISLSRAFIGQANTIYGWIMEVFYSLVHAQTDQINLIAVGGKGSLVWVNTCVLLEILHI